MSISKETAIELVALDAWNILVVPEELRDRDLYLQAVRKCGQALCCVPSALRDSELCNAALEQDVAALEYVPNTAMNSAMIKRFM